MAARATAASFSSRWAIALLALGTVCCASAAPNASTAPNVAVRSRDEAVHAAERSSDAQRTRLTLPFAGTWVVGQGYHGAETHTGPAAYALDLVKLGADGSAHAGRGRRTHDWHGFGADVLASADGVVVRAIDRFPDNPVLGKATRVNTLIVKHDDAEFSEYVHLQRGSLRVGIGERVARGQVLARAGNSGSQTPHLHWALLSSVDPIRTRPAVFSDYEVQDAAGTWRPTRGTPRSGDVIRPREATRPP